MRNYVGNNHLYSYTIYQVHFLHSILGKEIIFEKYTHGQFVVLKVVMRATFFHSQSVVFLCEMVPCFGIIRSAMQREY